MFALKSIVSGVVAMTVLSGCAATSMTQSQVNTMVNDRVAKAMTNFQDTTQNTARVAIVEENPVEFEKTSEPEIKGDVSLKMASAAFGPIISELAKQKGYSLVFGDNIDVLRKVTLNFDRVFSEDAIRTIALTAGYVAVFDKGSKTVYISETGNYVFRLPPNVFNKLVAEYEIGGDAAGSSGGSGGSEGGSGGGGGSDMKTEFKITGDNKAEQDGMKDFLKSLAGPTTKVSVTKAGYVHVSGTAQGIKRVHDFLKRYVREAMSQVVVDASVVEVALTDSFDAGIQWGKVIDKATSGAFINGSSALGTGLAAAGSGAGTAGLVSSIASTAGANSASGALNLYRVGASSTSIIKALKTYSDTNVVSNPKLYATSGTPATYFDGKEVPYLADIEKTAATANSGASERGKVSFAVSGTSFSVIPEVLDDKTVSMTVIPVISETGNYETFMSSMKVPEKTKRNSFHNVITETNKTLILGGLRVANNSKSTTLAANTASNNSTKEVVILLRVAIERPSKDYQILVSESI